MNSLTFARQMKKDFRIFLTEEYNFRDVAVFNLIRNGTLFRLTGADEISFDFHKNGFFSLQFQNRGTISGTIIEIIPNRRVSLIWNVNGFERDDEVGTKVILSIVKIDKGSIVEVSHTGIRNKISANAKQRAWVEILRDMKKELSPES